MLFNSLTFAAFLPIVFALVWSLRRAPLRLQNLVILACSYVFYGWWDWRFLSLIIVSSTVDYAVGRALESAQSRRRRNALLGASLTANLGLLGFFKYYGFFAASFAELLGTVGLRADLPTLHLVLPVGISFYTFQTLSYTLDIHAGKLRATRDPVAFFAFVSFFPQLVAGPIERARDLLPQFEKRRTFDAAQAADGARQMLWGLFKKAVIADNLAGYVDHTFANWSTLGAPDLMLGIVYFAFQIYGDFSGYSDVAIGTARMFGFRLSRNFAYPYFARSVGEFWKRWHISLSSWFRDYVYIPLGGGRTTTLRHVVNVLVTFGLSGLWHGANWTFVVWGLLNGLYYVPSILLARRRGRRGRRAAPPETRFGTLASIVLTFVLISIAWVYFRAPTLGVANGYLLRWLSGPWDLLAPHRMPLLLVAFTVVAEWPQRHRAHALDIAALPRIVRWPVYYAVGFAILFFAGAPVPFIYFQF